MRLPVSHLGTGYLPFSILLEESHACINDTRVATVHIPVEPSPSARLVGVAIISLPAL